MRMWAAQNFAPDHARHRGVGAEGGAALTLSTPSGRMVRWPIHLLLVTTFIALPLGFGRRFQDRANDLIVAGARQRLRPARSALPRSAADFPSASAEGSACRGADAALQSAELQKFCWSGWSLPPFAMLRWFLRHCPRLDGQHQAGADEAIIEHDAAGAAIARRAAFLRAVSQAGRATRRASCRRRAQELHWLAVDRGETCSLVIVSKPSGAPRGDSAVRFSSTPAILVGRRSCHACRRSDGRRRGSRCGLLERASSRREPIKASAAASTSSTWRHGASPTRAAAHTPSLRVRLTPQPTTRFHLAARIMRR